MIPHSGSASSSPWGPILSLVWPDPAGKRFGTAADMIRANKWRDSFGFSEDDIVAKIADVTATKSDGPPGSWAYFEQALISEKTARGLAAIIPYPTTQSQILMEAQMADQLPAKDQGERRRIRSRP